MDFCFKTAANHVAKVSQKSAESLCCSSVQHPFVGKIKFLRFE